MNGKVRGKTTVINVLKENTSYRRKYLQMDSAEFEKEAGKYRNAIQAIEEYFK